MSDSMLKYCLTTSDIAPYRYQMCSIIQFSLTGLKSNSRDWSHYEVMRIVKKQLFLTKIIKYPLASNKIKPNS